MEAIAAGTFAEDVRAGLTARQKTLPCKYLYDALGSALFDAITLLPEYPVTRAEEAVLTAHAGNIARALVPGVMVAELGSGDGRKTRMLLQAILRYQADLAYYPIDISRAALERCRVTLETLPGVHVRVSEGLYLDGLARLEASRDPWPPLLVLFLGSNIGNFDSTEAAIFLGHVRASLRTGDALLVGADLRKPVERLIAAYDDPAGVTAAFNLNLLGRINRELGGHFDLRTFRHEARWCEAASRMEMHLVSLTDQVVSIDACGQDIEFRAGESIWTESSYKFDPQQLEALLWSADFTPIAAWTDKENSFAELLCLVP
jgi:L-histidine N-alpha-methyltransferase